MLNSSWVVGNLSPGVVSGGLPAGAPVTPCSRITAARFTVAELVLEEAVFLKESPLYWTCDCVAGRALATGGSLTGSTVIETAAASSESRLPSLALKLKLSGPL